MRRGTSLIELLGLLAVLGTVGLLFGMMLQTMVEDVPKLQGVVQVSRVVFGVLERLQEDIDAAKSLPESHRGKVAGEKLLFMELPEGVVSYEVGQGEIVRKELRAETSDAAGQSYGWPVGSAKMSFHRWESSGFAYAVEVRRAVVYRKQEKTEDKLVNAQVFYLAGMPGRREK